MKPMDKPFRFYDEEYDDNRLSAMSLAGLRELLEDINFSLSDMELWFTAHPIREGQEMPESISKKLGFKAATLRFKRELERHLARRETPIAEAFMAVCKRDFQEWEFNEIMEDAKALRSLEEANR